MKHLNLWEEIIKNMQGEIKHCDTQSIFFIVSNNNSLYSIEKNVENNLIFNQRQNDQIMRTEEIVIDGRLISDITVCRMPSIQNILEQYTKED